MARSNLPVQVLPLLARFVDFTKESGAIFVRVNTFFDGTYKRSLRQWSLPAGPVIRLAAVVNNIRCI